MKMFFEEYGMVIVVMVVAFTLITVSTNFADHIGADIEDAWKDMVVEASGKIS